VGQPWRWWRRKAIDDITSPSPAVSWKALREQRPEGKRLVGMLLAMTSLVERLPPDEL